MPRFAAIGLAAGFFSALFGVGGGIVIVPLLVLTARFPEKTAMGTSLAAIGATALAGAVVYTTRGHVDLDLAALVGLPAALGAVAGTAIQQRLASRWLARAFAGLLVAVAVTLLVG